ncbi:formin CG32138 isoform X1 [Paramuricea clavata]|uniref:Formin CG32138 isoform X1 n=1 Tax=Paramuricea clavata TaxID=317549 RepID=A0A7D9J2E2_PARCT|nr:formin CG32138 isoform X1 [Paramuricea clavata]
MNGTRKKVAAGFKLESLYKLPDVRSTDRKMSLLNFVVTTVKTHLPELHSFAQGLDLEDATQVSKQTLSNDIQSLKKGIDLTKKERDKQTDNFVLFSFYNRAFGKVQKVSEKYRKMEEKYIDACQMFGEDGKKMEPSEFFKYFQDFINMYFKAENENDERKKQEEAQRQAEIMMRNQKNKAKTLPSIETAWNYTNDSDAYDDDEDDDDSSSGGSDSS